MLFQLDGGISRKHFGRRFVKQRKKIFGMFQPPRSYSLSAFSPSQTHVDVVTPSGPPESSSVTLKDHNFNRRRRKKRGSLFLSLFGLKWALTCPLSSVVGSFDKLRGSFVTKKKRRKKIFQDFARLSFRWRNNIRNCQSHGAKSKSNGSATRLFPNKIFWQEQLWIRRKVFGHNSVSGPTPRRQNHHHMDDNQQSGKKGSFQALYIRPSGIPRRIFRRW